MFDQAAVKPPHGTVDRYHGGCRCGRCSTANTRYRRTPDADRAARNRVATANAATGDNGWQFVRHARFPACTATVTTTAKSIVCCEREAVEDEGAGHDEWCPTVTASHHAGGDAA